MWKPLIQSCEHFVAECRHPSISALRPLTSEVSQTINRLSVLREDLPYGRYLVHRDQDDRFNIQLDIFSAGYEGAVHCHETWGMLAVIKGALLVEQWDENNQNKFDKISESILSRGSVQNFCAPISDWHKTVVLPNSDQVVTMHIYGKGFDLDYGICINDQSERIRAKRSDFKNLKEIEPYIKII
jgi:predicted metal-dependent enzyme (double-stranded beta helix superfamily)